MMSVLYNSELDNKIEIPMQKIETLHLAENQFYIEWNDHLKLWSDEANDFVYHWSDILIPQLHKNSFETKSETEDSQLHRDQCMRVFSKLCGCFHEHRIFRPVASDIHNTTQNGTMITYVNEKQECVEKFKQVRISKIDQNGAKIFLGTLHRNIYRTSTNESEVFIVKFFKWNNNDYFLLNESYGEIGVYKIDHSMNQITKYFTYDTKCFNDRVYIVDHGKKFIMYHWVWQPIMYYSYYDIHEFMIHQNQYKTTTFYGPTPYGDGMDMFEIIDGADYFLYYFHERFWPWIKDRTYMLDKYGKEANNTILKITYKEYEEMLEKGVGFPCNDYNVNCSKCGKNIYLYCNCEWKKKYQHNFCHSCNLWIYGDTQQCPCQDSYYEREPNDFESETNDLVIENSNNIKTSNV